ncbi:MAG: PEP-CTERM sorting domain-containing protein [Pontixanthobacter sp.]
MLHASAMDGTLGIQARSAGLPIVQGALLAFLVAAPANAAALAAIPEPSNMALFGLGVTGLFFGRMLAKRK